MAIVTFVQFIPIKTRILKPPNDDLFEVLAESLTELNDGDVVLVTSKIVSIGEGRCEKVNEVDIDKINDEDASLIIPRPYWKSSLTVVNNSFAGGAGTDKSNGDNYLVRLPKDPFASAQAIWQFLIQQFKLKNLGVIITDSRSKPLRFGATGVAIGWWGISPLVHHKGKADLFGRKIRFERSNLVDGLAAGAVVLMGEVAEAQPIVIGRGVPNLTFTDENTKDELFTKFEEDTFRVLYDRWL